MKTIFQTLNKFIKEADNVIIMTHKNADLDAIGSAICLSRIVSDFKIDNYVVLNKKNNNISINKALQLLDSSEVKIDILNKQDIKKKLQANSLLIIVDTSKKELVEYPELLDLVDSKIVIDHHVLGNRNIQDTKLSYINANLSSTNEIMVNYLKFLNKNIEPIVATIMLAGIEVDTNSFNIKTTADTFRAAAFLLEQGALNIMKKEILKEDKEQYIKREKYIEKSNIIKEKLAICTIDDKIKKEDLSVIAERMLLFDKVEAAFAIGKIDENLVAISARSLGEIDVYEIMRKFGGGGHITDSAAQVKTKSLANVEKKLIKEIEVL